LPGILQVGGSHPLNHPRLLSSSPQSTKTKTVIFGVPDCGKVCSEQHLPGYLKEFDNLRQQGVSKIFCVVVGDPAAAQEWAKKQTVDSSKVTVAADAQGGLTRLLGVEMGALDAPGARSQRYAAVITDGVLLKIKVDKTPAEVKESSAENIVKLLKSMI
jgi:peroxiredoxin